MKRAYVFPGQGSQFPGMGKDLYESNAKARELMEKANEILGFRITDIMFEGSDEDLRAMARICLARSFACAADVGAKAIVFHAGYVNSQSYWSHFLHGTLRVGEPTAADRKRRKKRGRITMDVFKKEFEKLPEAMESAREAGMQTFNMAILDRINNGEITEEVGLAASSSPTALKMNLKGIFLNESGGIIQ